MRKKLGIYPTILEGIFLSKFKTGMNHVNFEKNDIDKCATELGIRLPKNIGDLIYCFRYRTPLPDSIQRQAPSGLIWIIRGVGAAKYRFVLVPDISLAPNINLAETKVPDGTPGVVAKYALSDEQALLARVRYNRLIDIFLGIACYSIQNHLRTTVTGIGQVETDELYVGLDKKGIHYVVPVQAKGRKDRLSIVQIEQDLAVCDARFPSLICRAVGAQSMRKDLIALFEFEATDNGVAISSERHYRLVAPDEVSDEDLKTYRGRRGA